MNPNQLFSARMRLGLTQDELAAMIGYDTEHRRKVVADLEKGRRRVRDAQRRLVEAYLAGYRPKDWPR